MTAPRKDAELEKTPPELTVKTASEEAGPDETFPRSQALTDLEESGLTQEDMAAARTEAAALPPPAAAFGITRGRWFLLLLLAAAGGLTLAIAGEMFNHPARLWLAGAAGLSLLLLLLSARPASRPPRLPTRAGLAAALFSGALFLDALAGWPASFYPNPALPWSILLAMVIIWTVAAVVRKFGRRHRAAGLALGLVIVYAALGPFWVLAAHIKSGAGMRLDASPISFVSSPDFLTTHLPWPLWPQALALLLAPLLAAIFALWDQGAALRRPGARHGGNFFLALAFLGLLPSGLLMLNQTPGLVASLKTIAPALAMELEAAPPSPAEPATADPAATAGGAEPPLALAEPQEQAPPTLKPEEDDDRAAFSETAEKDADLTAQLERLQQDFRETRTLLEELEARVSLLSDRLNQIESPDRPTLNPPAPPLPPGFQPPPPDKITPNQPGAPPAPRIPAELPEETEQSPAAAPETGIFRTGPAYAVI